MKIKVEVTKEHLAAAHEARERDELRSHSCLIAQALRAADPALKLSNCSAIGFWLSHSPMERMHKMPPEASELVLAFDRYDRDIESRLPVTFEVEIPDAAVQS
jgi:hypothetical protein